MNSRTFYILVGAAVLALLAALWINSAGKPSSESAERTQMWLPQLRDQINDIDSVTMIGAGAQTIATIKRAKQGWSIAEKSGYPADVTKLREFLLKLTDATILEQKTSNPKLYSELGVDDVTAKDAKGTQVVLGGLKQPLKLFIGTFNGAGGGGTFVRRDGDAASWLVKGNLTVDKTASAWESRDIANIPAARLQQVMLVAPDGKTLKAAKAQESDANFALADVPKGREPMSDFAANTLGSTLADLKVDDVFSAKDEAPGAKVYNAHYAAFDGLVVDVVAWENNGKDFAQFKASLDSTAADANAKLQQEKATADYQIAVAKLGIAQAQPSTDGAPAAAPKAPAVKPPAPLAVSDPAKDREQRLAATHSEIDTLNKAFAGWTFVLPNFKFSNINKSMDDLLKPLEKKVDPKDAAKTAVKSVMKPGLIPAKPQSP